MPLVVRGRTARRAAAALAAATTGLAAWLAAWLAGLPAPTAGHHGGPEAGLVPALGAVPVAAAAVYWALLWVQMRDAPEVRIG